MQQMFILQHDLLPSYGLIDPSSYMKNIKGKETKSSLNHKNKSEDSSSFLTHNDQSSKMKWWIDLWHIELWQHISYGFLNKMHPCKPEDSGNKSGELGTGRKMHGCYEYYISTQFHLSQDRWSVRRSGQSE